MHNMLNLKIVPVMRNVQDGHYVMDVGSGWGGLMNFIADEYANTQVSMVLQSK